MKTLSKGLRISVVAENDAVVIIEMEETVFGERCLHDIDVALYSTGSQ